MLSLALGLFMAALDQTVMSTVAPLIQTQLEFTNQHYVLLTTAYLLGSTVPVLLYGQWAMVIGHKPVFAFGLTLFGVASGLCGAAQTLWQFIAARALQGVGSAALVTTALTMVALLFEVKARAKWVSGLSAVVAVSSLAGPLLGGFAGDFGAWRWVFFMNVPLGALALLLCIRSMPNMTVSTASRMAIDWRGAVWLAGAVIPLLLWASFGRNAPSPTGLQFSWFSPTSAALLAISFASVAAFLRSQLRAKNPLLELSALSGQAVAVSLISSFIVAALFLAPLVFLPLFMVQVRGVTHVASGLTVAPLIVGVVAGNALAGQLVAAVKQVLWLKRLALLCLAASFCWVALTLSPSVSSAALTAQMVALGLSVGPVIPLYTLVVQEAVSDANVSMATATVTFIRQLGATLGIALFGSVFASVLTDGLKSSLHETVQALPAHVSRSLGQGEWLASLQNQADSEGAMNFDEARTRAAVVQRVRDTVGLAKRAIRGEWLATLAVRNSGLADEALLRDIDQGGLKSQVEAAAESVTDEVRKAADAAVASAERRIEAQGEEALRISNAAIDQLVARATLTLTQAIARVFWWCAGLSLVTFVLAWFLPRLKFESRR
jgi:MFS family permease